MLGQRETVGHPGDEIADPPRPRGLALLRVPSSHSAGSVGGIVLIAREQIEHDLLGIAHHPHHPFVPVHLLLQERLDRGLRLAHVRRKRDQRLS